MASEKKRETDLTKASFVPRLFVHKNGCLRFVSIHSNGYPSSDYFWALRFLLSEDSESESQMMRFSLDFWRVVFGGRNNPPREEHFCSGRPRRREWPLEFMNAYRTGFSKQTKKKEQLRIVLLFCQWNWRCSFLYSNERLSRGWICNWIFKFFGGIPFCLFRVFSAF